MSPLSLRRYRAERMLREQFQALRAGVTKTVRGRLRARGVILDDADLDACYAAAWQGLYSLTLDGQHVASPAGWLALVTFRRAIDEHRLRARAARTAAQMAGPAGADPPAGRAPAPWHAAVERDIAAELDDRAKVRQLFEGLRGRLSARELQAATLCYLHGLSRSQAAARMGVSEARMRKLMEGPGGGRPGVAGKVGALVATIRDGGWCEEQASLMRGLAFGVLDPDGERYELALAHSDGCPACRAYVRCLRGLAIVLPPAPELLRWALAASGATGTAAHAPGAGGVGGVSLRGATSVGGGATGAGGAATTGAGAGGGWLLAGGGAAKLAVGCVLAAGVGAGCAALTLVPGTPRSDPARHVHAARRTPARTAGLAQRHQLAVVSPQPPAGSSAPGPAAGRSTIIAPAARASHEFGLEQPASSPAANAVSHAASAAHVVAVSAQRPVGSQGGASGAPPAAAAGPPEGGVSAAQREFGIGR